MSGKKDRTLRPPLAYRLRLFFGRPSGLRWVPDNHLGVVYRMEMYDGLRGPGFFRINPFTESVKQEISLDPDFIATPVSNLNTRDALQLGLRLALAYIFDPRTLSRDQALVFVKWQQHILRAIVTDFANSALLKIVSKYYAEQICRGELFEVIQKSLETELKASLAPLAIRPTLVMILEVTVPPSLQDTFTAVANRTAYTHDLSLFEPFELDEVRRRELNEVLQEVPAAIPYFSMPGTDVRYPARPAEQRPSQQTIRGTSGQLLSPSDPEIGQRPGTGTKSHLPSPASTPPGPDTRADDPSERPGISRKSHLQK